jgi:NADH dehydrogenase (ubiquinone) 1 alpha subcomplex subunit 9
LFKLNHGRTKVLPVHVLDVAQALSTILSAPVTSTASTFALSGPAVHTYNSLLALVAGMTMHPPTSAPTLPKAVAKFAASVLNRGLWWPTISPDEIERKYIDDFGADALLSDQTEEKPAGWADATSTAKMVGIDGEEVKSWKDLDLEPDHVEEHAIKYLRRYRSS